MRNGELKNRRDESYFGINMEEEGKLNWKLLKEDNYCEIKPIRRDGKREKKRGKVEGGRQQSTDIKRVDEEYMDTKRLAKNYRSD